MINDGSIVHSRLMSRSDLITSGFKTKGISGVETKTGLECTPSSSFVSIQTVHKNGSKPSLVNSSNFIPEYDISQRIEEFIVNSSTPRQLPKSPPSVTSTR